MRMLMTENGCILFFDFENLCLLLSVVLGVYIVYYGTNIVGFSGILGLFSD